VVTSVVVILFVFAMEKIVFCTLSCAIQFLATIC
jgi:hypothetical protein